MIALTAGSARVEIDPALGGRIERLSVGTFDLLVPPETNEHNYGAFVMAPWAGRIRHGAFTFDDAEYQLPLNKPPHAIHGTARDQRWTVEHASDHEAVLSTSLADPWPFAGRVVQRVQLTPDAVSLELEVHAAGAPMPASCGWHPWWSRNLTRGGAVEIELHAADMYKLDDEGIPTGELIGVQPPPWDDCFTELHAPVAVLDWPEAATVTIESDCSCVVVFTEPEHAVCVEPQSGPPDAFNLGAHVVERGEPLVVRTRWEWSVTG